MKKILYIAASLLFAACTHDELLEYNPELTLMFQPSMYMHMTHDNAEGFTQDKDFAVFAWSLPHNAEWSKHSKQATEFLPTSVASCKDENGGKEGITSSLWSLDNEVLWPATSERLTFMGYSPATFNCTCHPTDGVTCTMDVTTEQTDLLYTLPCSDREKLKDGGIVPLTFDHALCRLDLKMGHRVNSDEKITIKSIYIDRILHKGTFSSLHEPQWNLDDSYARFTLFEGSKELEKNPEPIGRYILLPPQKLATTITVKFEYTTAMQTSITQTLKTVIMSTNLKAGRTYTYTLSVGVDDVKFLQEIITNRL